MIRHFDHVTVVVRDLAAARRFFGLLGFVEDKAVLISGPQFSNYMGVEGIEADHVTLVLAGATPRLEVQLLHYRHPDPLPEPAMENLARVGFNHICFAVDDLEAMVARLQAGGVELRNAVMEFHHRRLVFLRGPEGITVELAEWKGSAAP
ncbi:VOC family protein [Synechococcus sp. BA-132 BA5]|uniref:VOC family protein n=1 Tax=Synechococcus sp. BA-132 BA5 TaxID=3110252 RepID=UPI002B20542A|nr:VOC family protein [Synechococcus sp. BA-132 BA5]MEA5417423.1 VOC family protein [Synechococcus sp. BA-132 BA5]